ncbi:hypothetical protein ROSEINA2194_00704 [Roseburia inulinivorans DSM 16841]|uniref:Uncharacterized protein n=1 Tax=Roseburia inulinivorans DSM 16841 TaxID=622312 RepID=C0FPQ2_9FIRM|nr:hypothetical protein ROSEINA2194_00704 [Roseburia inulinivorans DSM 16841]
MHENHSGTFGGVYRCKIRRKRGKDMIQFTTNNTTLQNHSKNYLGKLF